jgi:hypothetical protein
MTLRQITRLAAINGNQSQRCQNATMKKNFEEVKFITGNEIDATHVAAHGFFRCPDFSLMVPSSIKRSLAKAETGHIGQKGQCSAI